MSSESLFARPVLPVANEEDARATAVAALPRIGAVDGRATVVHVVEKAGGAPDKASVEQREALAEAAFTHVRERAEAEGVPVETEVLYDTDVADAIGRTARERDATAIVFVPRSGSRWADLLTGGVRHDLVTEREVPVVVLPAPAEGNGETGTDADAEGGDS